MRIELLKPYGISAPGAVLTDVPPPVAELLIARGVAKCIDETKIQTKPFYAKIRKK